MTQLKSRSHTVNKIGALVHWAHLTFEASQSEARWAFRGQSADYDSITPSLARAVLDRTSVTTTLTTERYLLKEFRARYGVGRELDLGMPSASRLREGYDLRCLSVMQHYEIPTRLVDWTSNFWVALYFACAGNPERPGELWYYPRQLLAPEGEPPAHVRSLQDHGDDPSPEPDLLSSPKEVVLVELDFAITPRMKRQRGLHTVCTHPWQDHVKVLQEMGKRMAAFPSPLKRILIAASCKQAALQYLADHRGITADYLFPDMAGLALHLRGQLAYWNTKLEW